MAGARPATPPLHVHALPDHLLVGMLYHLDVPERRAQRAGCDGGAATMPPPPPC